MAKKGKAKISKVKRNNQTTNKIKKQGKLKLQRHRPKVQKQKVSHQPQVDYSSESEASAEEWRDMLDEEEQQYIVRRLAQQPQLLANIPESEETNKSAKKRKIKQDKVRGRKTKLVQNDSGAESGAESENSCHVEERYEKEQAVRPPKRLRPLLPIKTKEGLQERAEEMEDSESETEDVKEKSEEHGEEIEPDSGLEEVSEIGGDSTDTEVTAVQLLAARRDRLQHEKLRIGALCSSLLECPEKKLKNLYPILYLMEERLKDEMLNLLSVRKLATLSACEVFRDILPDYPIRHQDYSNVKLKKDTLSLYKYEKELLEFYKRYLQRLEKASIALRPKKGDTRKADEATVSLALVSLGCMCRLLVERPHFNYATNIAQSVIPYLACRLVPARQLVTDACANVFVDDRRGDISLAIVRLINQLVKRRGARLSPAALDCLLSLRISHLDMDADSALRKKKQADEKHKKRIINLSKKEKKRSKKLKEVERELLETEAQESQMARNKHLTEVTKTVFHIYFRLLKEAPHSKLLEAALNGIAKFTHVINLEYYSDLVRILARLVEDEVLTARTRLLVVRAVLAVLAGAGDALNVDPAAFHRHLYRAAITTHAAQSAEESRLVVESMWQVASRARNVSPPVARAFAKRLATLCAQIEPHATLACLALISQLASQSKPVASLLDFDPESSGSGRFDPFLESPEHCNAHASSLHELCTLARHYHPAVRTAAQALATRAPHNSKMSAMQLFKEYDGSQMAFKPSVPPPKRAAPAKAKPVHVWMQPSLRQLCEEVENSVPTLIRDTIHIVNNK